ncbi:hypothetical protein TELCIR_26036 [Teladorsagia circumcincta]|uniref:Uncharacterized protein n=1 Tax=Teladorsagia circumcincta TaxID=45464 RepID=A0A2G9T3X9_TELCI|nr:hypothetical protein TELCIR_26036 [Teladorsagia circumcincta]
MKICVRFASCMETVRDYENECEQRFSRDFLTHGIDDGDVLRILNVSSVSRGMLAHRACLRFVEKSDYATVSHPCLNSFLRIIIPSLLCLLKISIS